MHIRDSYPVLQDLAQAMVDSIEQDQEQFNIIGIGYEILCLSDHD